MRVGAGRSRPREINEYSQTWRLELGAPRDPWPRRKHDNNAIARMNGRERSTVGRKEFHVWKRAQIACNAAWRARYGWKRDIRIRAYGPWGQR